MSTQLKELQPYEAWEDIQRRSFAAAAAGFVVAGTFQAAGAIPVVYRDSLAPASGILTAFLAAQILSVAYYHGRWRLGICGAALSLMLPYSLDLLWIRLSGRSLIYPMIVLGLLGTYCVHVIHRKLSGPMWVDVYDEELRSLMENVDSNITWVERVTWLCFVAAAILLIILLVR
jgi:hypothetical protein